MQSHASGVDRTPYAPIARVPLVPENILRRHYVHFEIDTRFRRAARLLQYLWLSDHDIPTGIHVQGSADNVVTMDLGSCLSVDAADAGSNLVFNLFGPMVIDPRLATAVFRRLLPTFVHSVESIHFEHSPGRFDHRFLMDGTAFDVALRVVTPEGESGTVFIELKYSEDMTGPAARPRPRLRRSVAASRFVQGP